MLLLRTSISFSVVHWNIFPDDPDPILPLNATTDPDQSFTLVGKSEKILLFFRIILVSGMGAIIFNIMDSILKLG
jgi:hypothetical protein